MSEALARRLPRHAFVGTGLLALVLHLAQALAPLKLEPGWFDQHTVWHFWILETLALTGMGLSAAWIAVADWIHVHADRIHGRWTLPLLSGCALLSAQIVLLSGFWLTRNLPEEPWRLIHELFWLNAEFRLPSLFSAFQLALGAGLSFKCYRALDSRVWLIVGAILGYMAVDELFAIHERIGIVIKALIGACMLEECQVRLGPVSTAYWVLVYAPLALALGSVLLFRLYSLLPRADLLLLVVAAGVFLCGAVGFESLQVHGRSIDEQWFSSDAGQLILMAEEGLEMLGVAIAVMVLQAQLPSPRRSFGKRP